MAKPTETDFINAQLATDRIMLRKMFEDLRDRPQSKYFKNVIIKNRDWKEKTFLNTMPMNFPLEFLQKYPYDFEISFTTLGCNMLKCYQHKPNVTAPTLINGYVCACSEACFSVYKEFNEYLREKFKIKSINENNNALPFETFSIYDEAKGKNFCGIQLTSLKTYSIRPSSRWWNEENISARDYINKYRHKTLPIQLRELSGLVDAPPLTWNIPKQNVHFNHEYCRRFNKIYNKSEDYCYYNFLRKGANFLFGESFVNMFPDIESILIDGCAPFDHLYDSLIGDGGLKIDEGYTEKPISQDELEQRLYEDKSDRRTKDSRIIDNTSYSIKDTRTNIAMVINNVFTTILTEMAKDTAIEMSVTTVPAISARLMKSFSSAFLERALLLQHSSGLPMSVRLFSLTARAVINDLTVKLATKMLTFVSSAANVLFAITIVTLIPDILLSYYNVGGFNNEITREQLNIRRKMYLDNLLKSNIAQFRNTLDYVVLDDGDYASPVITPEFIYHLCLLNFLEKNPEQNITICYNALGPEEEREQVALEYIKWLKVNSVGQMIQYENTNTKDDDDKFIQTMIDNSKNNQSIHQRIINHMKKYNTDIYILCLASILLVISLILLLLRHPRSSCFWFYISLLLYFVWFSVFYPVFSKNNI